MRRPDARGSDRRSDDRRKKAEVGLRNTPVTRRGDLWLLGAHRTLPEPRPSSPPENRAIDRGKRLRIRHMPAPPPAQSKRSEFLCRYELTSQLPPAGFDDWLSFHCDLLCVSSVTANKPRCLAPLREVPSLLPSALRAGRPLPTVEPGAHPVEAIARS